MTTNGNVENASHHSTAPLSRSDSESSLPIIPRSFDVSLFPPVPRPSHARTPYYDGGYIAQLGIVLAQRLYHSP